MVVDWIDFHGAVSLFWVNFETGKYSGFLGSFFAFWCGFGGQGLCQATLPRPAAMALNA